MAKMPTPIRARGKQAARWTQWRNRQRALVAMRSEGRCEGYECRARSEDLHHVFGRRHIVAEPLASHHTMCAALCRSCHNLSHLEPDRFESRWLKAQALQHGCSWFG